LWKGLRLRESVKEAGEEEEEEEEEEGNEEEQACKYSWRSGDGFDRRALSRFEVQ
jgi:hypothetical protein